MPISLLLLLSIDFYPVDAFGLFDGGGSNGFGLVVGAIIRHRNKFLLGLSSVLVLHKDLAYGLFESLVIVLHHPSFSLSLIRSL